MSFVIAERDLSRWGEQTYWHGQLDAFKSQQTLGSGIHCFKAGGLIYDIRIQDNGSDTTAFLFHGSTSREGRSLPFFTGNNLLTGKKANRVFISDPSLLMSKKLALAWYAGNSGGVRVQAALLDAIRTIASCLGGKRLIFFGPSGGGFASLYYSWHFPGSLAYAINPQTRIRDFSAVAVDAFAKACLGAADRSEVDAALAHQTTSDVRALYRERFDNHVVYVQNSTDHHVALQMKPFLSVAKKQPTIIMGDDWGEGHIAPPVPQTVATLDRLIADPDNDWGAVLARQFA